MFYMMTCYACIGACLGTYISRTEVSWNSSSSSFMQCTDIFLSIQLKKKAMLLQTTRYFTSCSCVLACSLKKWVDAGWLLHLGETLKHCGLLLRVLLGEPEYAVCFLKFPAAHWPSGTGNITTHSSQIHQNFQNFKGNFKIL